MRGGFSAQARGDDVGTTPEKLEGQIRWQPLRTRPGDVRTSDLKAPIRACAEERRDSVALQTDALLDRQEIALGGRLPSLDLSHARERLKAELTALAKQRGRLRTQTAALSCSV